MHGKQPEGRSCGTAHHRGRIAVEVVLFDPRLLPGPHRDEHGAGRFALLRTRATDPGERDRNVGTG
jgi:hypothetical protein